MPNDNLDRPMGGQTGDTEAISSQRPAVDPALPVQNPEDFGLPPDFPPGGQGVMTLDLSPVRSADLEDDTKAKEAPGSVDLFRSSLIALSASLPPGVGLRFLAWQAHHLTLLYHQDENGTWQPRYTQEQQLAMYIDDSTSRDALDDFKREAKDRAYNFAALHMEGVTAMAQAETEAHRAELLENQRAMYQKRMKARGYTQAKIDEILLGGI